MKARFIVPITLLLEFSPEGEHSCTVFQRISVGYESGFRLLSDPLIKGGFMDEVQKKALQVHFREEFTNLEGII